MNLVYSFKLNDRVGDNLLFLVPGGYAVLVGKLQRLRRSVLDTEVGCVVDERVYRVEPVSW
jgi:hypothetical protein